MKQVPDDPMPDDLITGGENGGGSMFMFWLLIGFILYLLFS